MRRVGIVIGLLVILAAIFFFMPRMTQPSTSGASGTGAQASSTASDAAAAQASTKSKQIGPHVYTSKELLAMADNKYANGEVPLGDNKYVTTGAKKGYVYLCRAHKDPQGGGAGVDGPWIHATSWNFLNKTHVSGSVSWPNASFTDTLSGSTRTITTKALPIDHTTGVYPIMSTDAAYAYDRNPNGISAQSIKASIPGNPVYSDTPYCMGGEVGIMLSGVPLFDAFDAGLRDAPAHELQDSCDGHPQNKGEYHYHSLSACFKDISVSTVLGYAYDGFPITGPHVAAGKYLTTEDLDECHGLTSVINENGKQVTTYHYVMTQDFPYSASCFRGKPAMTGTLAQGGAQTQQPSQPQGGQQAPPQEAIAACSGKTSGASCSFTSPRGDSISGHCDTPPGSSLACVPR